MQYQPLNKQDVIRVIERKNPSRIPLVRSKWWGEGFEDAHGPALDRFDPYPEDVVSILVENPVNPEWMDLSWEWQKDGAHDMRIVIDDWDKLDEFIDKCPDPENHPEWERAMKEAEAARANDQYVLFGWWNFFFEKPWDLRGMENLMIDHYMHPDYINKLHDALCGIYEKTLMKAAEVIRPDGFWTSDDLGHQTGAMLDPSLFDTLLMPYYQKIRACLDRCGMHFWLHSCGDNTRLLKSLIASGVDVFHPVQKHTMDEQETVRTYGDQITFFAGIDVQHTLIEKTPDEVRKEVRFLIDTFDQTTGGMFIGAGNGILPGTPLENIEAFMDEALTYGSAHRKQLNEK